MFIRNLKSFYGKLYVQVVDKSSGRYNVFKCFGGGILDSEIKHLLDKAQEWINSQFRLQEFDFNNTDICVEQFL